VFDIVPQVLLIDLNLYWT